MDNLSDNRYNRFRILLIVCCMQIGIGALAGGICMLVKPDGSILQMGPLLPYFQVLPFADVLFQDYVFAGISLIIVNGITNLAASWLLLKKRFSGIICGGIFGVTLMMWIIIQFLIFPPNFLDTLYFGFGLIQMLVGFACYVFYRQAQWVVDEKSYPAVGSNPDVLVVYFSRLGRVRKVAFEEAQRTGGQLFEIKPLERVDGTLGFWWCGRFGMHGWPMDIASMPEDLNHYRTVIICSPVWVFGLSAPIREFCALACGQLQKIEAVIVHFNPTACKSVFKTIESLTGLKASKRTSIECHWGFYSRRRTC